MMLLQRPAESQTSDDKEETACKDAKSVFKFRAATLQSGPADSKYSNNGKLVDVIVQTTHTITVL